MYCGISFMSFVIFMPLPLSVSLIAFPYQTHNCHDVMACFQSLVRENGTHGGTQRLTKGVCRSVHIYFRRIEMLSPLLVDCYGVVGPRFVQFSLNCCYTQKAGRRILSLMNTIKNTHNWLVTEIAPKEVKTQYVHVTCCTV